MTRFGSAAVQGCDLMRRRTVALCLGVFALAATPGVLAQESKYPARPVTLVLPFTPGGLGDTVARRLADRLSSLWKVPVLVNNRPGAGGNLGAGAVAKADPDGYTLLITVYDGLVITKAFGTNVGFDPTRDLVPIALPTLSATVIVANPSVPAKDFSGFISYAKANPGKLNFGSNGVGSSYHLALEQLNAVAGTDIRHVPYKGSSQAVLDLLGGRLDATILTAFLAGPYVSDGRLKALAISSAERSPLFPGIPTVAESGYAGYEASVGMGVFAPAGLPEALVASINADIRKVVQEPELRKQFLGEGTVVTTLTPAEFAERFRKEISKMQDLIARKNLKLES